MEKVETPILSATQLWHASRVLITDKFDIPPEVLRIDESVIGTLGNFSASTGKAKSKKTFNVSAIVAAALKNGTVLHYRANFPLQKQRIIYVDTEQSKHHCKLVIERILKLADLPLDLHPPTFELLSLRRYQPNQRIEIIREAIYKTPNLGLVIIDGIRDLAYDINSSNEATTLISLLMQWTDELKIHIHTVLHQNKGDDHSRGHIGTELNNKAETILQIAKADYDKDISIVSAVHIRTIEFEKFSFCINNNTLPELVDNRSSPNTTSRGVEYEDISTETHYNALKVAFSDQSEQNYSMLIPSLMKGYESIGHKFGRNKIVGLKVFLINSGMLLQEGKTYSLNSSVHFENSV